MTSRRFTIAAAVAVISVLPGVSGADVIRWTLAPVSLDLDVNSLRVPPVVGSGSFDEDMSDGSLSNAAFTVSGPLARPDPGYAGSYGPAALANST
ncbi:MAG: hypothetical protein AAF371_05570 [Pseudomonadota bacterium]